MKLWKFGWLLVVTSVVLAGCATGDIDDDGRGHAEVHV